MGQKGRPRAVARQTVSTPYNLRLPGIYALTRTPTRVEGSCHCGHNTFEAEIERSAGRKIVVLMDVVSLGKKSN
jgi:hypothetical protein